MHQGIIKREHVRIDGDRASDAHTPSALAPAKARCGKKSVVLVEHAGEVRALEFTCGCGEVTLIELLLEAEKPPAKVAS
jgi:hypothetical protein